MGGVQRGTRAFSVIMPAYNSERTIERAIDSALSQEGVKVELIVIDDRSTDGTREKIKKYGKKIRYVQRKQRGVSGARNLGIRLASHDLIAFLDSDDEWLPGKLKYQAQIFEEHPEVGVVATGMRFVSVEGRTLGVFCVNKRGFVLDDLLKKNLVPTSAAAARKSELAGPRGGFRLDLAYGEDYLLWIELSRKTQFWITPLIYLNYTAPSSKTFSVKYKRDDVNRLYDAIERSLGGELTESRKIKLRSKRHLELATLERFKGDYERMIAEVKAALGWDSLISFFFLKKVMKNIFIYVSWKVRFLEKK